jgi:hypothetical protein
MSLDLNKLENKLDEALSNETSETLTKFLNDKRMTNNKQQTAVDSIIEFCQKQMDNDSSIHKGVYLSIIKFCKELPTDEIHWKSTLVTTKPILQGDNTLNAPLVISQTASTNTAQGYWVGDLKIQGGEQ